MLELDKDILIDKLKHVDNLIIDFEALREHIKDLLKALKFNYPFDELEVLYNEMIEHIKSLNLEQGLFNWIFWYQTKFKDRRNKK